MDIVNEIIKLKNCGLKINEIASKLNIPVGTVKSKLFRYKNKDKDVDENSEYVDSGKTICKMCGKEIKQVLGKKIRLFCSDYCRVKFWRKHKNESKRNA